MPTADGSLPNRMINQMTAYIGARAIYAAAKLRLADHLLDGPTDLQALSARAEVDDAALKHLMNVLCGLQIFRQGDTAGYSLTPLGETLLSEHANSVRDYIIEYHELCFRVFDNLVDCVRTGAPVFEQTHGMKFWDYLNADTDRTETFQAGMRSRTRVDTSAILDAYDFADAGRIVDVGGGNGSLLQAILRQYSGTSGILFDQDSAMKTATANVGEFGDRCRLVAGSFFDQVPGGGDTYVLKLIIHDWPDADACRILANCRAAIKDTGKLLIIDGLLSPPNELNFTDLGSLTMMTIFGSRERSEEEFADLLKRTGFRLTNVVPTSTNLVVMEARPIPDP